MIVVRNLAQSSSGAAVVHVSTNNGSSYYTTSGDYTFIPVSSGTEGNTTGLGLWITNTTSARAGVVIINGANVTGAPRYCQCLQDSTNGARLFVADNANDIDAVRVTPNAGTWSAGGLIYCFKR
jgi:hypothetical protein